MEGKALQARAIATANNNHTVNMHNKSNATTTTNNNSSNNSKNDDFLVQKIVKWTQANTDQVVSSGQCNSLAQSNL